MKDFQQRVIDELNELEEKANSLNEFIAYSDLFLGLDSKEQERLRLQLDIMWQYVEILRERIAAFN